MVQIYKETIDGELALLSVFDSDYQLIKKMPNFYKANNVVTKKGILYANVHLKGTQQIDENTHEDWDDYLYVRVVDGEVEVL